jgi:Rhodopirellula transposase DDE domain
MSRSLDEQWSPVSDEDAIAERYAQLLRTARPPLDERDRRLWAAAQARAEGRGGIAAVVQATGISESTVRRGLKELDRDDSLGPGRVRRPGAGRASIGRREPGLEDDLDRLIDPVGRGSGQPPLRWTCRSGAKLAAALRERGHRVVDRTVLRLLRAQGYSLQANRHTRDGTRHPDRDAQFEYISRTVSAAVAAAEPVIVVDVHARSRVRSALAAAAIERALEGLQDQLGVKPAAELSTEHGWTPVGITPETAHPTVDAILGWWQRLGEPGFPRAHALTIIADCGGSSADDSGSSRLWPVELQRAAEATGLEIVVCHLPAGTTRWDLVDHRLRNFVGVTTRGGLEINHQVVISLIAPGRSGGPATYAWLDVRDRPGPATATATDTATATATATATDPERDTNRAATTINLARAAFQGDWNYRIKPSLIKS